MTAHRRTPPRGLLEGLGLSPGDLALDVGCGDGAGTRWLARSGAWFFGLDLRPGRMASAALRWRHNVAYGAGDASSLPLRDGSFDAVACCHVLHHLREREAALMEMARVLRRGGRLGIVDAVVPSTSGVSRFLHEAHDMRDGEGEVRFSSARELPEMIRRSGFQLVRMEARLIEHDLAEWARRGHGAHPPVEAIRKHFSGASPALRGALRMQPATGEPQSFSTIETTLIASRA